MEIFANVECPWCGERFEIGVDPAADAQRLTTDCEVCCRPIELVVETESGRTTVRVIE
jgi:sarcosine oxidase delta subunit